MVWVIILLIIIAFFIEAYHDHLIIKLQNRGYPEFRKLNSQWHLLSAWNVGVLGCAVSIAIYGISLKAAIFLISIGLIRWVILDGTLNHLMGRPIFYVGQTAIIDKTLRIIASKINIKPEIINVILKSIIFIGLGMIILVTF